MPMPKGTLVFVFTKGLARVATTDLPCNGIDGPPVRAT
jgi:hypothetical protein